MCLCLGQNTVLVNDLQKTLLKLQAECDKLQETTRNLQEDILLKQNHIEVNQKPQNHQIPSKALNPSNVLVPQELLKTTEELEERKADKQMVEREIVRLRQTHRKRSDWLPLFFKL